MAIEDTQWSGFRHRQAVGRKARFWISFRVLQRMRPSGRRRRSIPPYTEEGIWKSLSISRPGWRSGRTAFRRSRVQRDGEGRLPSTSQRPGGATTKSVGAAGRQSRSMCARRDTGGLPAPSAARCFRISCGSTNTSGSRGSKSCTGLSRAGCRPCNKLHGQPKKIWSTVVPSAVASRSSVLVVVL